MQRVTLKLSEWGPFKLCTRETKKKCCLGFGALRFGIPQEDIINVGMPAEILEIYDMEKKPAPDDFRKFVSQLRRKCSKQFVIMVQNFIGSRDKREMTYEYALALVNDWYHQHQYDTNKEQLLEQTLTILKQGFKNIGYQLVVSKR